MTLSSKPKDLELKLSISVALSEEEMNIRNKYGYLKALISRETIQRNYKGTPESFRLVRIDALEPELSRFSLVAHVGSVTYLGNLQLLEEAVIRALTYDWNNLKLIDAWEGEEVVQLEAEGAKKLA